MSDRIFASVQATLEVFEPRGIGPVDSGDHIGGNNLATLSLKSTFPNPIPESLRAKSFVFFDIGNVWGVDYSDLISDSSKVKIFNLVLLLTVVSPIGPLSLSPTVFLYLKNQRIKSKNFYLISVQVFKFYLNL